MSLAYKVEELLALRDSVSESAISIDKFADEDVIKEHVLRPSASASANLASRSSNRSLRPSDVPAIAPATLQKRPSPSPSVKRGKAEKLLKEHGSPPGMRVTAGGRIVPSDLPLLGTSRFGDNTYKPQALRVAPGNVMSTQLSSNSNTNSTARIEVIGGQPVVFVGDRMFALPAVNTADSTMPSGGAPAMESTMKQVSDPNILTTHGALSSVAFGLSRANTQTPFGGLDLPTLKAQQTLKKQELRTVEQTEVLQASHQSEAWRASMIEKKRCLIVELDAIRKQISALDNDIATPGQPNSFGPNGIVAGSASVSSLLPQFQQGPPQTMYAFSGANPYASMTMYQPPFGVFPGFSTTEPTPFVPAPINAPHSPGSGSRRSHAVEIKPPRGETKKQVVSGLDPKSPTYEPAFKPNSAQDIAPPTPSPPRRPSWREQQMSKAEKHEHRALSHKHSLSSIDTTDFFPTNTHEHSSTRVAPRANDDKRSSNENTAVPSTPEKHWPASPWNDDHAGRSGNHEPVSTLTSWPEAFGKQRSLSSSRQGAAGKPFAPMLERAPAIGANASNSASSNNGPLRTNSDQRTGTEENWPFSSKVVTHVPSTYQEGYQAGYDHVGISDSPEVLQGYIQGLMHFLSDESKKRQTESSARDLYVRGIDSRTPSLRGLVAGSMPHDSAVSMTFGRSDTQAGSQENVLSANGNLMANSRRDFVYSPRGSVKGAPVSYTLCKEVVHDPRQRNASSMKFLNPTGLFPDRLTSGHQQAAIPCTEHDMEKMIQEKGIPSRVDSFSNGGASRQPFGNQRQNHGYATPLSMQRFYPSLKEVSPRGFGEDIAPAIRPFANHRLSGLDGAMDDLAEMMNDTQVENGRSSTGHRSAEAPIPVETEEVTASCFKPSNGRGKQKATFSPSGTGRDKTVSSPINPPSSPKKSGELSPAKAKLEQVTNKFRRVKKDDPRAMSPEDKMKRSEKWRQRFQQLKQTEIKEIEAHRRNPGA